MWEYKTVRFSKRKFWSGRLDHQFIEQALNQLGSERWELVSLTFPRDLLGKHIEGLATLKRPT